MRADRAQQPRDTGRVGGIAAEQAVDQSGIGPAPILHWCSDLIDLSRRMRSRIPSKMGSADESTGGQPDLPANSPLLAWAARSRDNRPPAEPPYEALRSRAFSHQSWGGRDSGDPVLGSGATGAQGNVGRVMVVGYVRAAPFFRV
jgi:hypothetical protein